MNYANSMMGSATIFLLSLLLAFALTWKIRRLALTRGLMDVPNARSSHEIPTPRGGGLSFVIITLCFAAITVIFEPAFLSVALATFLGGGAVAAIGVLDDYYGLSTRIRMIIHTLGAIAVVAMLGPIREIPVFSYTFPLGVYAWVFTILLTVWLINLTNFMDGINGIASVHSIGYCAISVLVGTETTALLAMVLGGSVLGFIFWNFPQGRIFMGDVGSGFLGIMAMVMMLGAEGWRMNTGSAVLIMLAPFIVDATLTLIMRLWRGEHIFQAHRIHLYQRLARIAGSHTPVTLGFVMLIVGIMVPLALWAAGMFGGINPGIPLWIAYLFCIAGWLVAVRSIFVLDTEA